MDDALALDALEPKRFTRQHTLLAAGADDWRGPSPELARGENQPSQRRVGTGAINEIKSGPRPKHHDALLFFASLIYVVQNHLQIRTVKAAASM